MDESEIFGALASPLQALGISSPAIVRLTGDASAKQFWRVSANKHSFIVLLADRQVTDAAWHSNRLLAEHEVRVPRIEHYDRQRGLVLYEDLGDWTLAEAMNRNLLAPEEQREAFWQSVDMIATMQRIPVDRAAATTTPEQYLLELDTLTDWLVPDISGRPCSTQLILELFDALRGLLPRCRLLPMRLSHRDFYAGNLMWTGGASANRLAVIDYENMSLASPAYDLVALLQDLRRPPDPQFESQQRRRFVAAMSYPADEFDAEYYAFALLRSLRVFGLWHRLKNRDSKPQYLKFSAHTRQHVTRNLDAVNDPAIATLFYRHLDFAS